MNGRRRALRRAGSVTIVIAGLASCGGGPPPPGIALGSACVPFPGELDSGATLDGRDGSYRLVMVRAGGQASTASAEGTLRLDERPRGMRMLETASTPLSGWTDVDVEAVGGHRVGDLRSQDLAAPGVLVIEADGSERPSIFLRLGSDANRRDPVAFDAAYSVLSVTRVATGGFAGTWASGARSERVEGYFCAQKRTD